MTVATTPDPHRRRMLRTLGAASMMAAMPPSHGAGALQTRVIAKTGERLPVVGIGTWQTFDVGPTDPAREELKSVLSAFVAGGGSVIDSSPMYGQAERVVGDLVEPLGLRKSLFLATKVWTRGRDAGIREMNDSLRLLRTSTIDLMQVHNLLDLDVHRKTLRDWKAAGKIRHLGITHYHAGAHAELERLVKTREYDFLQINFSMGEPEAEARLLGAAADAGTAVIINRPFAQANLFGRVKGKPLPAWAADFDCASWAQFFLKWIISHPAVTCAIPGTRRVSHLEDNMQAGIGGLPDAAMRRRMVEYLPAL